VVGECVSGVETSEEKLKTWKTKNKFIKTK